VYTPSVTVAAFPVTEPEIGLVTVKLVSVPTDVRDELRMFAANVVPVRVPAVAVTVISAEPLNDTPLMLRAVASVVAVAAFPVVFWLRVGNEVSPAAEPVGVK
jgi:hypothetical protein